MLSPDTIKSAYGGTDLHVAAYNGDLAEVEKILAKHPEYYLQTTEPSEDSSCAERRLGGATAIHYALMNKHYAVVERLLTHPDCKKIINIANSATESILHDITALPDEEETLKLIKLALDIEGIQINFSSSWISRSSALSIACLSGRLQVARLLLERGAEPNILKQFGYYEKLILVNLAHRLDFTEDKESIEKINAVILLLLDKGIDYQGIGPDGKTFFDHVIGNSNVESKLNPQIKDRCEASWKTRSPEEIEKAHSTYVATSPFASTAKPEHQSPSLTDTALLVSLKKERRLVNQADYDCTVLYNRKQLDLFIKLAKIRFEATKEPFQTQFIMRPREGVNPHVANGQLSFDAQGNVSVFWVDSLGHDDKGYPSYTRRNNEEIGKIIHNHLPNATLYTTDAKMQRTASGCHNIAMYISERLSAAASKQRDLFGDLSKIHQQSKREQDGFRIIPWKKCPAYTGIPRIIQSASKPLERIKESVVGDDKPLNRKNQNYEAAIKSFLVEKDGKIINTTYDMKRQKFGEHIKQAYDEYYNQSELGKKKFRGFTDIVDRIPITALINELRIKLISKNDLYELIISPEYQGTYLTAIKGTLPELSQKLEEGYNKITTDKNASQNPNFLLLYAAIRASKKLVNDLELETTLEQALHKTHAEVSSKPETILEQIPYESNIEVSSESETILEQVPHESHTEVSSESETILEQAPHESNIEVSSELETILEQAPHESDIEISSEPETILEQETLESNIALPESPNLSSSALEAFVSKTHFTLNPVNQQTTLFPTMEPVTAKAQENEFNTNTFSSEVHSVPLLAEPTTAQSKQKPNATFLLNALITTAAIGGIALAITALFAVTAVITLPLAAVELFAVGALTATFFYRKCNNKKQEEETPALQISAY